MARMDELYNDIYTYCEENGCWKSWNTAKEWNECLEKEYSPASFTALVVAGRLERRKSYKATSYEYHIVPTGAIKAKIETEAEELKRKNAERVIKYYDENVARIQARYEELIKDAEEYLKRGLECEAERLTEAKTVLGI